MTIQDLQISPPNMPCWMIENITDQFGALQLTKIQVHQTWSTKHAILICSNYPFWDPSEYFLSCGVKNFKFEIIKIIMDQSDTL